MSYLYILVLSAVQGLTEFLPVSSSAHLVLAPKFLHHKDQGMLVDVALNLGTLAAALIYYLRDVFEILLAFLKWNDPKRKAARNLGLYIGLASIPALALGFLLHVVLPDGIRSVSVITFTTLFFGVLMGYADNKRPQTREVPDISLRHAMFIGLAQCFALIPGTSRSGVTMTAARWIGMRREDAARFSFLLGMPATGAAGLLGLVEILRGHDAGLIHESVIAVVLTFLFGISAIYILLHWIRRFGLMPYVVYRMVLGVLLLGLQIFAPHALAGAPEK